MLDTFLAIIIFSLGVISFSVFSVLDKRKKIEKAYKEWLNFKHEENEAVANGTFSFGAGNDNITKGEVYD